MVIMLWHGFVFGVEAKMAIPSLFESHQCLCTCKYVDQKGSVAMSDVKRSAGVTLEVNQRNPLHAVEKECKKGIKPALKPRTDVTRSRSRGSKVKKKRICYNYWKQKRKACFTKNSISKNNKVWSEPNLNLIIISVTLLISVIFRAVINSL